jgi:hypothetical protein
MGVLLPKRVKNTNTMESTQTRLRDRTRSSASQRVSMLSTIFRNGVGTKVGRNSDVRVGPIL